jgi:hypothetical protein
VKREGFCHDSCLPEKGPPVSFNNLGENQGQLGETADAVRSFRQAPELQESLARQSPADVDAQSTLGGICNNWGLVWAQRLRWSDAADFFVESRPVPRSGHRVSSFFTGFLRLPTFEAVTLVEVEVQIRF